MEEDEQSPVPQRRAPPMNSPFVPSVARCASAEAEEKRQVAAARCVIQAANVALFICVTVLRRIIVRSEPCEGRGGEGGGGTKQQDARRHTGVLFSRLHARFLYEVVAPSLGIPMAVLEAVLGSANPAGRSKDEPGLICAEAFLHAEDEGGSADRPSNFDPVARPVIPIYGPLLQAMPGDAFLWFASARTAPTPRHPVTLYAGNLADGSISTIPGKCTLGFIHDLEKLSPDFVTAVLTSVTCGSARRGGLEWGGVPLGADWPSALLTHDMPGTAVLTEWQMATLLCDKAKLFFSTYRARTLPVDGATGEGPALAKGVPAMQLDADTGLLHCRDGRSAAKNELLPPTEEISGELRATLADLYSRLRRQYPKPPGLIGASGAPMDLDEEHDVMPPALPGLPISGIGLSSESRASLKRTCVEAALPLRDERWLRRLFNGAVLAELGGLAPTRLAQESLLDSVVDSAIDGTLASASILGNAELRERISQLEKQCEDLMKQFNTQKEHKLRFKTLAQNLEAQLRQAIMDAQTARAVGRDQGAGIGATEPASFEQALAEERQRYQDLAAEAAEYKAAHQRAINARDDVASEFRVYKEQTTIALRTAEIQSSNQQSLIASYREQLYDSRAAASALAPTPFLARLSSIIAPLSFRLQGTSRNLQGEFKPFRTAHEQAHGSRSSADGAAGPAHYAICATARIELP